MCDTCIIRGTRYVSAKGEKCILVVIKRQASSKENYYIFSVRDHIDPLLLSAAVLYLATSFRTNFTKAEVCSRGASERAPFPLDAD